MTDTRVLAYEIRPNGTAGELVAVGSLLLPYLTTFHPDLTDADPAAQLSALRKLVGHRKSGQVRVRLAVRGDAGNEAVDGTVFFGSDDDGENWVASAVLDRPSSQPCFPLPVLDPPDAPAAVIFRLFEKLPLRLTAADRTLPRPGRPRGLTTSRQKVARPTAAPWPPAAADGFRWAPDRPDWLPPLIPWPPLEIDIKVLRVHCPIICMSWWCSC